MIGGSCLCSQVAFAVSGQAICMINCHCPDCRKAYGSAFGTVAICWKKDFQYLKGRSLIGSYRQSDRVTRYFCKACGLPLPIVQDWDAYVGIPAGRLEDDPGVRPSRHIFVSQRAPWWEITDDAPQFAEYPPGGSPEDRTDVDVPGVGGNPP